MDKNKVWKILGIESTKDKGLIKEAYRKQLLHTNPEDNAEGFMELRNAYEEAIRLSSQIHEEEETEKSDIDLWISQVDAVYQDFHKRRNIVMWEELLENEICSGLDTWLDVRERLLVYLMNQYYLPNEVWGLFDNKFDLARDSENLSQTFPKDFIDYVIRQIQNETFMDFDLFRADRDDDIDDYIRSYYNIKQLLDEDNTEDIQENFNKIDKQNVYHPYIDVEKLRYYTKSKEIKKIEEFIQKLSVFMDNSYIAYYVANAYWEQTQYDEAASIWESICEKYPLHYGAKIGLLEYYIYKGEYKRANEEAVNLLDHYQGNENIYNLLRKANELLIEEYKQICEREPDNTEIKKELAWCYYQNTCYDKCLELLQEFPEEEKGEGWYLKIHGYIYLRQNNSKKALEYFMPWLEKIISNKEDEHYRKDFCRCNYMIGISHIDDKNFESSITYLKEVVHCDENEIDLLNSMERLAYAYLKLERNEDCIDECNKIIEKSRYYYPAYLHRQEANFNMKNGQEVINDYHNAIEIYPDYVRPYLLAVKVYYAYEQYKNAIEVIDKAREIGLTSNELELYYGKNMCFIAKDEKDKQAAIKFMEDLLLKIKDSNSEDDDEKFSDVGEVLHELARAYANVGWFSEGLDAINKAINYKPSQNSYYQTKAYLYMDLDKHEEAAKILEWLLKTDSKSEYMNYSLAECYEKMQLEDEALEFYEKTLEINPNHIDAIEKIMDVYKKKYLEKEDSRYYKMGIPYAERLFKLADRCYYYVHTGLFYETGHDFEEALRCYERSKECDADEPWAYNNGGYVLKGLRQMEEAIEQLKKSISLMEPGKSILPHSNLADCYEIIGKYEKSMECYQEILKVKPDTLWADEEIAQLYKKMKKYEEAVSYYNALAKKYKNYKKDSYYKIMRTYEEEGNFKNAEKYARKLIRINCMLLECGEFYYNIGKLRKAKVYTKNELMNVLESSKKRIKLCIQLAAIYFDDGKINKAKHWSNKALEAICKIYGSEENYIGYKPQGAKRCNEMGMIYLMLQDYEKAEEYFKLASKHILCKSCRYQQCYEAFFGLGRLYEAKKQFELSEEYYKKALEYNLNESSLINRHYLYVKKANK